MFTLALDSLAAFIVVGAIVAGLLGVVKVVRKWGQ